MVDELRDISILLKGEDEERRKGATYGGRILVEKHGDGFEFLSFKMFLYF